MQVSFLRHLRRNAVAYLALFVALGGTSFAAATVITGKNVKNGSLTGLDVKNSSLTGGDVKNKSLRPADFSGSVQGPTGPQGPKGDTGTVDTSNFYDKAASDSRFLGVQAKAADADKLDGIDSAGFIQGAGRAALGAASVDVTGVFDPNVVTAPIVSISGVGSFAVSGSFLRPGNDCQVTFTNTSGGTVLVNANPGGLANGATVELAGTSPNGGAPEASQAVFSVLAPDATKAVTGIVIASLSGGNACSGVVHAMVGT